MKLLTESDYRAKVLNISFEEAFTIATRDDITNLRTQWMKALQSWHSPYKALIDCKHLSIDSSNAEELTKAFAIMIKLLNGFFLRKAAGYNLSDQQNHKLLPFEVFDTEADARSYLGIREAKINKNNDLRSQIQFDNHFRQNTIELSSLSKVIFDSSDKIVTLKDKLTNNLMQWHSSWNLIVDCANISFTKESHGDFERMSKFFKGFFLKNIVGYNYTGDKTNFPFPVFKARHKAAASIVEQVQTSGDEANCRSRKPS